VNVLVVGAGGFLGSGVARGMARWGHSVSALARTADKAAAFTALGYTAVSGDFGTTELIDAVERTDAVVNCTNVPWDQEWACIAPILERMARTDKPYITTSGTGVLSILTPQGEWRDETFAEDDASFRPPPWAPIRLEMEAKVRHYCSRGVRSMVVRPPMIWGHGGSVQLPHMQAVMRRRGYATYVGLGLNVYSNVHVDDLADLYCLALERGTGGALYHAVSGETAWRHIAEAMARSAGTVARSITIDDAKEIWGEFRGPLFFGVSSRSRSPRARDELGWTPTHLDILDDVEFGSYRTGNLAT
jgi:nucleoside-diphosphate-sugar epimerase